jgi:hypothetical protein
MVMVENKPKKSNRIIGALTIVVVITTAIGIFVTVAATPSFPTATVTTTTIIQSAQALADPNDGEITEPKAPWLHLKTATTST